MVELVRWTVVSPTHQGSNPGARIISEFISGFSAMRFQWEETFPSLLGKRLAAARVLDLSVARGGALLIRRYS